MAYSIAVIKLPDMAQLESKSAQDAFEQAGHTVTVVTADEDIADNLLKLDPDLAYIAIPGNMGEVQMLLEAIGLPYIGNTPSVLNRLADASMLSEAIQSAVSYGEIEQGMPASISLSTAGVETLLRAGAADTIQKTLGRDYPLNVTSAHPYTREIVTKIEDAKGLEDALRNTASSKILIEEAVEGLEVLIGIMGDLDNILILPPFTFPRCERVALTDLSAEEAAAQDIRSEMERTALDAFILSGCRDVAVIHLVWDGGRARILNVDPSPAIIGYISDALSAAQTPLSEILDELAVNAIMRV